MRLNYIDNCDNIQGIHRLPDNCVDLTVTSPPYDNLRNYKGFSWDAEGLITELYRVTKLGGVVVWVVNDATVKGSETGNSFRQALAFMDAGFNLHDTMIWKKKGVAFPDTVRYYTNFEYMFVFSKGKPKTVHLIADKPNVWAGARAKGTERGCDGTTKPMTANKKVRKVKDMGVRFNVWELTEEKANKTGHPAVFPTQLAHDHIISWSNPGDIVLDPFMGSGTTALACIKTDRNYIGFEISTEYCAIAHKRIIAAVDEMREAET